MSGLIYRNNHRIKGYECDITGEITLPSLVNLMVDLSGQQSDSLGNTNDQMSERGLSWIIVQYDMQIKRMPHSGEAIILETEAMSYNRFFTYRRFRAYDESEQLCVEVMTNFVMMDIESRKMVQIQKELLTVYQADEIRTMVRMQKPIPLEPDNRREQDFRVRYLDIDYNRHVNNAKYFDWIINTIDPKFIMDHQLSAVTIKYEKEVEYGNSITSVMSTKEAENGETITAHRIMNGEDLACEAHIVWKKV